jgi:predicted AAA+ superfamily ATPase
MIIDRPTYLEKLDSKRGNGMVKVVTGVRRCGKSFLVFDLFKKRLVDSGVPEDRIICLAFDEFPNKGMRDPNAFWAWATARLEEAGEGERYVLLDEVQLLGDFESVLIGLMRMPGVDVYVTGSNARLLSRDIVTEFRGRGDEVMVRPLSFREFMGAYVGDVARGYEEYATYGGMPAVAGMADAGQKAAYLQSLFSEIYINDIVERNGVRNAGDLATVFDVVTSAVGSLTNPRKIADTFKSANGRGPGQDTVRAYIDHFVDAFLLEEAKRFDLKGRRYIGSPFKYYPCDMGLRNARMNFRQVEPTHAMECVLYNELRSRGYGVDVGVVADVVRDGEGRQKRVSREVDFVCNRGSERCYIQSAYAMPDDAKREQEARPLEGIDDSFKKIIVVKDPVVPRYSDQGILICGVYDYLLDETLMAL